jgi:hypothetical protein
VNTQRQDTTQLGELVAAVFDKAERYSNDPLVVSLLATQAVFNMLRRAHRALVPPSAAKRGARAGRGA